MAAFTEASITDQKRLVRAAHWRQVRAWLRIRDGVHHAPWRLLMVAGGAPAGEVACIRELMPKAVITAVDRDPTCLEAAIAAGVDDVIQCDLSVLGQQVGPLGHATRRPPPALDGLKFDAIMLDLCGVVDLALRRTFRSLRWCLRRKGIRGVTFSYGRDVVEVGLHAMRTYPDQDQVAGLIKAGVPETVVGRLCFLLSPADLAHCGPISLYSGPRMPMCSILVGGEAAHEDWSVTKVEPGDFELAVLYGETLDPSRLYDCPKERIDQLRRQFAALKAAITRRAEPSDRLFA